MCLGCNRNQGGEAKAVTDGLRGPPPEAERITNLNSFLPMNSFRVCSQGQYFSSEDVYLEEEKLSDHHEPERRAKLLLFAVTGRRWKLPEGAELRQGHWSCHGFWNVRPLLTTSHLSSTSTLIFFFAFIQCVFIIIFIIIIIIIYYNFYLHGDFFFDQLCYLEMYSFIFK